MENEWWCQLVEEIQGYANSGNQQQFYLTVKAPYGARWGTQHPVRNANSKMLITEKSAVLELGADHYRKTLNRQSIADIEMIDDFPKLQIMRELDLRPSEENVRKRRKGSWT